MKKILLTFLTAGLLTSLTLASPADYCGDATDVTLPYHDAGSTVGMTDTFGRSNADVLYSIVVDVSCMVIITTCQPGTDYDTYIWLLEDDCVTDIAFNDDACEDYSGLESTISQTLSPGTYKVCIEGYSTEGNYELDIAMGGPWAPPADPILIPALPFQHCGNTVGGGDDFEEECPYSGSISEDREFEFTPQIDSFFDITLCQDDEECLTDYDTKLYIYDANGVVIACNDDACSSLGFSQPYVSELLEVELLAGETYYIIVDGYGGHTGNFNLQMDYHDVLTEVEVPASYELSQNYPNPFNPTTTIEYSLVQPESVNLSVYNLIGVQVMTLVKAQIAAGHYSVQFNAASLPSGVYFYTLRAGEFVDTKKMILVK